MFIQKVKNMIKLRRKAYKVGINSIAVTIPAAIVEAYGIEPGDRLLMEIEDIVKPDIFAVGSG